MEPSATAPSSPLAGVAAEFPILGRQDLTYLDTAASSQKPLQVIEAMDGFMRERYASIHRGVYQLAAASTEAFEGARAAVADWIGASPRETIFTGNATQAINTVAYAWGRANVKDGDVLVLTEMEHHSNIVPWQILAGEKGARIRWVRVDDEGALDLDDLDAALATGAKLVGVAHVSNVLGTINPVAEVARRARAAGAVTMVDGSQAAPHLPLDMAETGADFYAFTGHKMYGPTGIGVLWGRRELLQEMPPFIGGGHMISSVGDQESTWNDLPWKFEAGTSPIVEAVGLGAAVEFLERVGMDAIHAHEAELTEYALQRLGEVPGLTVFGPPDVERHGSLVSFALEGAHPHDLAEILGRAGVCVRAGHHCAQPLMRRLGVPATTRASLAVHSTREEVDRLVEGLAEVRRIFGLS